MAFGDIIQFKKGTSTSQNVSFSFDVAPTNGNDIVLFVAGASYMQTTGSGWSEYTGMRVASPAWLGMNCWYRKQSGSGNSFSYSLDSAANSSWIAIEYEGGADPPFDTGAGQHTNTGAGGYTTPSITPAAGDVLLLGAIAAQRPSADMSGDTTGWTNSFTHLASSGPVSATGDRPSVSVGYRIVTANGSTSYSTGANWPFNAPDSMAGQIIAFKKGASGPVNKTLDANSGSYTVGGTDANLKRNRRLSADSASYSVTGTAATPRRILKLAANSAAYAVTGATATFSRAWRVAANSGSYSLSGTAANVELHRRLNANSGSYAINGTAATLKHGRAVVADAGGYTVTGANTGMLVDRILFASGATYSIAGADATLNKSSDKVVVVDTGFYTVNGSDAGMSYSYRIMPLGSATYAIGGYPADIFAGIPVPRNSLNEKIKYGGPGSMGDLARRGSDIEVNFASNKKISDYGPHFWGDYVKQGGDVAE